MLRKRAYRAPKEAVGVPVRNWRQIQYLQLPNAVSNLDKAFNGSWVDCGFDLHNQLEEFGGAAKVWITVLVRYEPANPDTDKRQVFDQYLSAAPTRIFKQERTIITTANPNTDILRILTKRIREFNAKFIRDKSGMRLAGILQFSYKDEQIPASSGQ